MLRPLSLILALLVVIAVWRVAVAQPEPTRPDQAAEGLIDPLSQNPPAAWNRYEGRSGFPQAARNVAPGAYRNGPLDRGFDAFQPPPPSANRLVASAARPSDAPTFWNARPADEPPHAQLQTKAFELDRLAHQLETASNYDDADAIREAARSLRSLARKLAEKARPTPAASLGWTDAPTPGPVGDPLPALQSPQPADPPRPEDE